MLLVLRMPPFGRKSLPRNNDRNILKSSLTPVRLSNTVQEILIHCPPTWLTSSNFLGATLTCVILTFSRGVMENRTILFPWTCIAVPIPVPFPLFTLRPKVIPLAISPYLGVVVTIPLIQVLLARLFITGECLRECWEV